MAIKKAKKRLPKGIRKYIRRQKAQIRKNFSSDEDKKKQIKKLYDDIFSSFGPSSKQENSK